MVLRNERRRWGSGEGKDSLELKGKKPLFSFEKGGGTVDDTGEKGKGGVGSRGEVPFSREKGKEKKKKKAKRGTILAPKGSPGSHILQGEEGKPKSFKKGGGRGGSHTVRTH